VDDDFYDHPKVKALAAKRLPAVGLHFLAISWSNRYLTDGYIDLAQVKALGGTKATADALVAVRAPGSDFGLWEEVSPECYRIHDFLVKNKSREQVLAERAQKAEAGRKGGLARAGKMGADEAEPKQPAKQPAKQEPSTVLSTSSSPRPVPSESRPVNSLGNSNGHTNAGSQRAPDRPIEPGGDILAALLTPEQLESWAAFGPEWAEVKRAWVGKGLKFAPGGDADDDPEAEHPSQRAMLHSVLVDRPTDLPDWIRECKTRTAHEVIAYVLERWHALRVTVDQDILGGTES
jgi:hypothetical protein